RKPDELIRAFAEVMIHHVALVNGIREGARGLLGELSPAALTRKDGESRAGKKGNGVWDHFFPTRARWRRFLERHHALVEEEAQLTAALFGPEFARAYTAVASENVEAPRPGPGGQT